MIQTEVKKETSIDWLMNQLYKKEFIKEVDGNEPINLMNQAKEMEKKEKLKNQLFFGKVSDILGWEKTLELLIEAKNDLNL
jgi:hypothetical protein